MPESRLTLAAGAGAVRRPFALDKLNDSAGHIEARGRFDAAEPRGAIHLQHKRAVVRAQNIHSR
jgi:hypothetical protein